ncbi:MAG: HlyD family secretion protein [Candidatus Azotimanducaceae bacterium]|jgi:HlyD family secretion protein
MSSDLKITGTGGQDVYVGRASNKTRYLLTAIAVLAAIGVAYVLYVYLSGYINADNFFERSKVRTAIVVRGDYERGISVEGSVVATFSPTLYAQDSGEVFLKVREGDTVQQGTVLALIENPELISLLKREEASLRLLEVELDTLNNQIKQKELNDIQNLTLLEIRLGAERRELDRMSQIVSAGSISVNDFEKTKDEVHALEVQVENTREQNALTKANHLLEIRTKSLSIGQQNLFFTDLQRQVEALRITSPVNGVVGDIQVKEQDTVAKKQPVLNVVDLSSYEVEVLIPETYAEGLRKGLPVRVAYRNNEHQAHLSSISPQVKQGSVAARVVFDGVAPSSLRENLRLNNKIILESKQDVLKVQRGPFVESHGGRGAYVLEDNDPAASMANYRRINVGSVGINEVEIVSGLQEGDVIIISNTAELLGAQTVLITN